MAQGSAKQGISQASVTVGQDGVLIQAAVTTAAPTYTTGQTNPLSLTTAGSLRVDGSGSTQPVSGSVTANAGTNLNTSLLALETGGNLATIKTNTDNLSLAQASTTSGQKGSLILGAATTSVPSYANGQSNPLSLTTSGLLRVDGSSVTQPVSVAASVTVAQATGSNLHTVIDSGSVTVTQTTGTNLHTVVDSGTITANISGSISNTQFQSVGAAASGATKSGNPVQVGGVFNTTQPTVTTGQVVEAQSTARGGLIVSTGVDTFNVTVNSALPAGSNTIGSLTANQSVNLNQVNGSAISLGHGTAATAIRVELPTDGTGLVNAAQSGTWAVTANAGTNLNTSLLALDSTLTNKTQFTKLTDGTNTATVTAASTAAVATDLGLVVSLSPNSTGTMQMKTDTSPATQNITVVDSGSSVTSGANSQTIITGTATVGSVATFSLTSWQTVQIQVSGTWTGTLQVELSPDSTTYYPVKVHQLGLDTLSTSFTANFAADVNGGSYTSVRVRATAAMTGTATVRVNKSTATQDFGLNSAVRIAADQAALTTAGLMSVKFDQTTPGTTNGVQINAALPAGSAIIGKFTTDQTTHGTTDLVAADITKVNGSAISLGHGTAATAIRVELPTDGTGLVGAAQSGTWNITNISGTVSLPTGASTGVAQASTTSGQSGTLIQGAVTTAAPVYTTAQTSPLSLTTGGLLRVDGSGVTQPVSGTVSITANSAINIAQVAGTNTVTGGVAGIIAVGGNVANGATATANPVPVGGVFTTAPTTLTTGQTATLQFTAAQNLKHDITTIAGTAPTTAGKIDVKGADGDVFVRQATAANLNATVVQATGTNLHTVVDSGSITANAGTNLNTSLLALETGGNLATVKTNTDNLSLAIASTTAGQKGNLIFGAVTTAAPTYTTAQSNPLSLTTGGLLRVDGSGVTQPVSLTSTTITGTVASTQSGTWNITNISGTVSLPTGASTAAKQPALGTAGTASADVITVQGIASMTALKVDGSAVTQPVSGTVSITANSAINIAQVAGTNTVTGGVAGIIAVGGNVANAVTATANPVPVGGVFTTAPTTLTTGQTATLQFTAAQNVKQDITTIAGTAPTTAGKLDVKGADGDVFVRQATAANFNATVVQATGSNLHVVVDSGTISLPSGAATSANQTTLGSQTTKINDGTNTATIKAASTAAVATDTAVVVAISPNNFVGVSQATASFLNAQVQGAAASGATKSGNPVQIGGVFNTTQPTVTTGQAVEAQSTARGGLIVSTGVDAFNVTVNTALPAGTNYVGKVRITDGTNDTTLRSLTSSKALDVAIVDGSGNQITSFGGGTQFADGAARGTATGTLLMVDDGVNIQSALGTTAGVLKVDISSTTANATAIKVDGSAVTQPVSGTVSITANSAINIAQVAGTNTVTGGVAGIIAVGGNVANGVTATANPVPVGGVFTTAPTTLTTGQTATLQFTAAQNLKHDITTIAGTAPTTAGKIDVKGADGDVFVRQATAANLNAQVVGNVASAATDSGNPIKIGSIFNTAQPTVTTGQRVDSQATARGGLIVATGADTFNVTVNAALPTGSNVIGKVSIDQTTPGTTNLVSAGQNGTWNITNVSGTVSLPTGASTSANQTTLGSQTTKINDGTNTATVKAASTAAVAADTALVVTLSPNNAVSSKIALTASSPTFATIAATTTAAVASNANRKGLILINTSANTISIGIGVAAVLNSGITLVPYGSWSMDEYTFSTAAINAIASAGSSNLSIQEFA